MLHTQGPFTRSAARRAHAQNTRAPIVMELIERNDDVDTSLCAVPQHSASTDRPRVCRACAECCVYPSGQARIGSNIRTVPRTPTRCEQAIIGRIAVLEA